MPESKAVAGRTTSTIVTSSFLLMVMLIAFEGCAPGKDELALDVQKHSTHDIDGFILDKLEHNRVVMLADNAHFSSLYYQSVTSALNRWLDRLTGGVADSLVIPRKLFLVLEMVSGEKANITRYFETGDIFASYPYADIVSPRFNTARVEFYSDLRDLKQKIAAFNADAPMHRRIEFDIVGPEKDEDYSSWSREKGDSFFFYERDEYSSQQVIDLLDKNPDYKALIYYGGAHLNKSMATKPGTVLTGKGYCMAHYLEEHFGQNDGLFAIMQIPLSWAREYADMYQTAAPAFAMDNHEINSKAVLPDIRKAGSDGTVVYFDLLPVEMRLERIWSRNMIALCVRRLQEVTSAYDTTSWHDIRGTVAYLTSITGSEWKKFDPNDAASSRIVAAKWRQWYDTASIDMVAAIESQAPLARMIDHMAAADGKFVNWYELLISSALGIDADRDTTATPAERAEAYRAYLQDNRRLLTIEHLVHLLWIGTEAEKNQAVAVLQRETKQAYVTAKDWTSWWRKNCHKL